MPHFPKPFFRSKKNRWYVQLDGKHVNLGPDKEAAFEQYHKLMADHAKPKPATVLPTTAILVVSVLDQFLDWLQNRVQDGDKAQRTYDWYFDYLQSFANHIPRSLTVDRLEPIHVYAWADAQPNWKTGKRGAMSAIQRAVNWAARAGLLKSIGGLSPIAHLEKPAQGRREQLVTVEEYQRVLALVKDQEFLDLLESSWETGARPHELFTVEASYVDLGNARWVFPILQSKGKKYQRVIYLTDKVLEITKRLMLKHPQGPLFRNEDGKRWQGSAVKCRFQRLCQKLGVRYSLYAFRHSWCTAALETGELDAVTVSVLMGHRDTQMISRHYAHLTQRSAFLRDAARKAKRA